MSKVTYLRCDFCGRDASQMIGGVYRHKIRRERWAHDWRFYDNLDICSDCLSELCRKVRGKKTEE